MYEGLPRQTLDFLAELEAAQSREWFEQNRDRYEKDWLNAGLDLVAALAAPCAGLEPPLLAVPKLNSSLRRIYRDVRFSQDKRPYAAQLHLILSTGPAFNKTPGVHLLLGPDGFAYGAGHYGFSPEALERYRQAMENPVARAEFAAMLTAAQAIDCALDAPELARVPRGFTASDWDHLIRRKSVIVRTPQAIPIPDSLFGADAVTTLMQIVGTLAPIAQFLVPFTKGNA